MLKSLFHWKVLLNLLLAIGLFVGVVWLTFKWLEYHTHHGEEVSVPGVINMTVHDAIKVLDDAGLEYEVDSFKYDPKYRPFQVLQIFPSAGSRVKNGRTIILKVNPKTWAPVAVPDILDRYKGLAFRQLDLIGLKVGDTIYEPSIQRDAVIRMQINGSTIKPGALLPRFSTIDLVIGSGPRRNVMVPNLIGLTVQEAKAIIAQNLFEFGLIDHEDGGADESDIVFYQDPAGGALRDQGMQVDLWASKKTPGQMSAKIGQLNAIYRTTVDTTMPPPMSSYPQYNEPVATPRAPRESQVQETPRSEVAPKPTPKPAERQSTKASEPITTEPKPPKTEAKPKAKKVVVE